jgi:hypothetical protein
MPERERAWCAEMGRMNPTWRHNVFGNEILEKYGREPYVKAMIDLRKPWAFVCDRIRVLLLKEEGGVWLDPDCQPVKPLDSISHVWDGPHTFVAGFRSPDRPQVALHRGVTLLDNTFLGSAKDSRMIRRLAALWKPESVVIDGHATGVEVMRSIDTDVAILNHRYFYSLQQYPETIALHDGHNLASWVAEHRAESRKQLQALQA